jgi:superfamily I DNA and RNA helicase
VRDVILASCNDDGKCKQHYNGKECCIFLLSVLLLIKSGYYIVAQINSKLFALFCFNLKLKINMLCQEFVFCFPTFLTSIINTSDWFTILVCQFITKENFYTIAEEFFHYCTRAFSPLGFINVSFYSAFCRV